MKIPNVNVRKLKKDIRKNEKEKLEFIDKYVQWLKKHLIKSGQKSMQSSCPND